MNGKVKLSPVLKSTSFLRQQQSCLPALKAWVEAHHPYDVPAVLTAPVETSKAFLVYLEDALATVITGPLKA